MPEPDPKASRAYIWTISCFLFTCIIAGGGCLLAYITIPESQSSSLLPVLGFTLVCMPWIFWIVTILYRITSRAFGFRMVIGSLYSNGSVSAIGASDGGGDAIVGVNDVNGEILDVNAKSSPSSPENFGRHVQFDEAKNDDIGRERNIKFDEAKNDDIGRERNIKRTSSSSSNSSNDVSVTSHESEMALALSMES